MAGFMMLTTKPSFYAIWRRSLLFIFALLLLPGLNSSLFAAQLSPQEVAKRLQEKYDATTSMSADFTQVTSSQMSRRAKEGRGSMVLLKPGRMRWDYESPDRQVIVCDGQRILMYFAKENQMLVAPAKQYLESDVTYSFFAGKGDLLRDFNIAAPAEEDLTGNDAERILRVVPKKEHPQIDYILLWTDEKFLINRLMIVDKFGSTTDMVFSNVKLNGEIPERLFSFTPPAGTEIIKQ
jgi:outer membrane lipoprotein carrier protein